MISNIRRTAWLARNWLRGDYEGGRLSYGQFAEDVLIWEALKKNNRTRNPRAIRYLDLGANHPTRLSNTMFFYNRGAKGILVEPNPVLVSLLSKNRPRDLTLPVGVAAKSGFMDFYQFDPHVLSTFCERTANGYVEQGYKIVGTIRVRVTAVQEIIQKHFSEKSIDLLSIDVEGLDVEIVDSIDWNFFRPKVVCVETWNMAEKKEEIQISDILRKNSYQSFAQAGPNTIFLEAQ